MYGDLHVPVTLLPADPAEVLRLWKPLHRFIYGKISPYTGKVTLWRTKKVAPVLSVDCN